MSVRSLFRSLFVVAALGITNLALGQGSLTDLDSLPRIAPQRQAAYGTAATSYLSIGAWEFSPFTSAVTYDDLGDGSQKGSRYPTGGIGVLVAMVNLPNGALLTSLELDLCDSNAGGAHIQAGLVTCDLLGQLCGVVGDQVHTASSPVLPCVRYTQDLTSLNHTVDNLSSRHSIFLISHSLDNTNSVSGALIGYKLQVSPAPATATFGDVPTSHIYFRAVEALAASGITSGCGNGNYCPDQPVTRGEIAKFLANALGLHHP